MTDIAPNDVVVCVNADPPPFPLFDLPTLVVGRHYRVTWVGEIFVRADSNELEAGINVRGAESDRFAYPANRFRKLEADDTEISERIRACRPVKVEHRELELV